MALQSPVRPQGDSGSRLSLRRLAPLFEALATPHGLDRYLELVHPMLTVRELRAEVTEVRRHPHAVMLTLRPTRQWQGFEAGQFVQVAVDINGVRHTRCYSPACSQHRSDGRLELTVKTHDRGKVSQYLRDHAVPGLVLGMTQADGEFVLPQPRPGRILLISGGSGITPVLAMLRTLCDEGYDGEVAFLHYAPSQAHVGYRDVLDELAGRHPNFSLAVVATRAASADSGTPVGRFGAEHLAELAPWWQQAEAYVCGPASLMDAVRGLYAERGLADHVHTEAFTLTPIAPEGDDVTGEVRFERSDIAAANSGATLLEQAEAAGLSPEHGCRMGICFSCTQVKRSGCTRDVRTGETHTDPDTEIQLCINVPVGDVSLDI